MINTNEGMNEAREKVNAAENTARVGRPEQEGSSARTMSVINIPRVQT